MNIMTVHSHINFHLCLHPYFSHDIYHVCVGMCTIHIYAPFGVSDNYVCLSVGCKKICEILNIHTYIYMYVNKVHPYACMSASRAHDHVDIYVHVYVEMYRTIYLYIM